MSNNIVNLLEHHFDTAFTAPNGIQKLRELILTLAMQGKLVPQDPNDQPASELLKMIEAEKQKLVKAKKIKAPKPLPEVMPEEVPYELPLGWEWVRLGDICSYIQRGKGPKYADFSTHRVISQKCVRWYGLDLEPARYIEPSSLEKYEPIRFLQVGDLLWNSTGTGTIGRACLVPKELAKEEIIADSHVTVVRAIAINSMFLWRWIQSPAVQNEIEGSASGTTNQIELNTSTVISHLMPLPPLEEQHRIVNKIDQLMARCDELEKLRLVQQDKRLTVHAAAIKQLLDAPDSSAWDFIQHHFGELYTVKENVAELRKAILQLAVMGKLVPQDPNDPPASELLKSIENEKASREGAKMRRKDKELPVITAAEFPYALPQGWEWVRLGSIGDTNIGLTYSPSDVSETGIPVLRSNNIQSGMLDLSDLKRVRMNVKESVLVQEGDLLICARNGSRALVGKTALITGLNEQMAFGAFMAIFRSSLNKYLLHFINSPLFRRVIDEVNTMTINQITQNNLKTTICPLPPLPEQHRIVAKIDQLMALCDTLEQQIDAANSKQSDLLDAMMAEV